MKLDFDACMGGAFIGLFLLGFIFSIIDSNMDDFWLSIILLGYGIALIRVSILKAKLEDANCVEGVA